MAEARRRAFRVVRGIGHPGEFRPPNRSVYFRTDLVVEADAMPASCVFEFSGAMRLVVNERYIGWWPATPTPREVTVDLKPWLRPGANHFLILLFGTDEPVCLRSDPIIKNWRCAAGKQHFEDPQELPFVGRDAFPHQEKLPSFSRRRPPLGGRPVRLRRGTHRPPASRRSRARRTAVVPAW